MTARTPSVFAADRGGNVAILFAVAGVLIIGAGGVAFDYARWTMQRSQLQDAVDAGALGGAVELGLGGAGVVNRARTKAQKLAAINQGSFIIHADPVVTVDQGAQTVTVNATMPAQKTVSGLLIQSDSTIAATSTAKVIGKTVACIYVLNPTASPGLRGNGSAIVQGTNCAIYVNSSDANAMSNTGTIAASAICVVGGYSGGGYSPAPTSGCPPVADPFASLVIPAAGACTATNLQIHSNTALSPGVYCGGIKVTGGATVTLAAGEYHLVDGPLDVKSGASIVGSEIVFILSGTAGLDIAGSGEVSTTPPAAGALAGFSIVQDRAAPLGTLSKVTGEGKFEFPGVIYLPRSSLEIKGRAAGNAFTPTYTAIVADTVTVSGEGDLFATADTSLFGKNAAAQLTVVNAKLIQ
jgi:Flp pilus assembly protein TadG